MLLSVTLFSFAFLLSPRAQAGPAKAPATDNRNGTLTAPPGDGSDVVTWQGTVPGPRGGAQLVCDDTANAWFYTLTLSIPSNYYLNHHSKLNMHLYWLPTNGLSQTQDLDLWFGVHGNGTVSAQASNSTPGDPNEDLTLDDQPAGVYDVIVCAKTTALDQPFLASAAFEGQLISGTVLPPPEDGDRGIKFSATTVVDPQRGLGEPSLRVDSKNNIYSCGPAGSSHNADYIQKSEDFGDTFRILGTPPEGRVSSGGGGDCELSVGTAPNINGEYTLSYVGLEALANFSTGRSLDAGRSFAGTSTSESPVAVDRQWMESSGASEVYLGYNNSAFGYTVQRSTDGGLTYGPLVTGTASISHPGPLRIDRNPAHNPLYNHVTGASDEIIYYSYTQGNGVGMARSLDEGHTWQNFTVATGFDPNNLFMSMGIDSGGNLYAVWTEGGSYNVYYAFSLRGAQGAGDTWSAKRLVNRLPVNSTVMPWIEAGDPGKIAVAFYGSTADGDIQSPSFPGFWDLYVATSFNALAANPADVHFAQTKATTHPVHYGDICTGGLGCTLSGLDRTLLDFFQLRTDVNGGMHIVFANSNKVPGAASGRITIDEYVKQIAGPGLIGTLTPTVDLRPVLRTASADPLGDAKFPFSAFGPPPPACYDLDAMDITSLSLVPQCKPAVAGTFDIQLQLHDASDAALNDALTKQGNAGSPAASLLFVVRFFSGTDPYSAVAKWNPSQGFTYGFSGLRTQSRIGEIYPGDQITIAGGRSGNVITMTVVPTYFQSLVVPAPPITPTTRVAQAGDRIYEVTAFTFGNASAVPETQGFLNQADSTAPFDYIVDPNGCRLLLPIVDR